VRRVETSPLASRAPLSFSFEGRDYAGVEGDTLASALLANGIRTVGRSASRGRPRGIFAAGAEEPNAFVEVGGEPMLQATRVALVESLAATPSVELKGTCGEGSGAYSDKAVLHCDVLVVGGGPAGLAAAHEAGADGARVVLVDERPSLGGSLLDAPARIGGESGADWLEDEVARLGEIEELEVILEATALGHYDGGITMVAERGRRGSRLWRVQSRTTVLATGALERSIAFAGNDLPGVMLAGAVQAYLHRHAVAAGDVAVLMTTNDSVYPLLPQLRDAEVAVAAVLDSRPALSAAARTAIEVGFEVLPAAAAVRALGGEVLTGVEVGGPDGSTRSAAGPTEIGCDLLAVSGGFDPSARLYATVHGSIGFDPDLGCFAPRAETGSMFVAGAARGVAAIEECLADGIRAGRAAAVRAGFQSAFDLEPPLTPSPTGADSLWLVPAPDGDESCHFVDLHRDATVADVRLCLDAGLHAVEHVKRATKIGTGADQGKTSSVLVAGVTAQLLGRPIGEIGVTRSRPPYVPATFALLAGRRQGALFDPERRTTIHDRHVALGAEFEDVSQWKRPWYYPRAGETMEQAVARECRAARAGVAIMDASTLGKIDIQGPDAVELLDRLYTNSFATLPVGSCRYGLMCHADGMVFDDGVVMHVGEDHFVATTTTTGAAAVMQWMEEWHQTEWPQLRVSLSSVTEQWATVAVAGPDSRAVLAKLTDVDLSREAFPFMGIREGEVAGMAARIARVSFSGELAFEVHVRSWDGPAIWEALMGAGAELGITPYGTEAMHVLRAEKGFVIVGQDTDGTVTPHDLGMSWIVSKKKEDFVGARSLRRRAMLREDRKQLVGVLPLDPGRKVPEGAQLVADPEEPVPMTLLGHVTSSYYSPALERCFGLALLSGGEQRLGERLHAPLEDGTIAVEVTRSVFYDPEGERRDG
jgi:sarcosine oxidase subunit alpha